MSDEELKTTLISLENTINVKTMNFYIWKRLVNIYASLTNDVQNDVDLIIKMSELLLRAKVIGINSDIESIFYSNVCHVLSGDNTIIPLSEIYSISRDIKENDLTTDYDEMLEHEKVRSLEILQGKE